MVCHPVSLSRDIIYIIFFFSISGVSLILAGFVNPGCVLPPIADPELYFIFDKVSLQCQKANVRQSGRFMGDRIYSECLLHVLEQWRFPRRFVSILHRTFISKKYQDRLFHKWDTLNFLVERPGLVKTLRYEMIEVSNIRFHFPPIFLYQSIFLSCNISCNLYLALLFLGFKRSALRIFTHLLRKTIRSNSSARSPSCPRISCGTLRTSIKYLQC